MLALFDLLYDQLSFAYEAVSWLVSAGRWLTWVRLGLRYAGPEPIVEVGPGPGHLLRALHARGRRGLGIERSAAMARRSRRRAGGVPVVRGDARTLPLGDGAVGTLMLTFPAPFVLEPAFWDEARRVVRPGGRVVVVDAALPPERGAGRLAGLALRLAGGPASTDSVGTAARRAGFSARRLRLRGAFGSAWLLVAEFASAALSQGPQG